MRGARPIAKELGRVECDSEYVFFATSVRVHFVQLRSTISFRLFVTNSFGVPLVFAGANLHEVLCDTGCFGPPVRSDSIQ